jgi:hypothetical protein
MSDFVFPAPSSAPAAPLALTSHDVELTHAELVRAVAAVADGEHAMVDGVVTPYHLVLAWSRLSVAPPSFAGGTLLVAAPASDLDEVAAGALSVVRAGGWVHCARSLRAGDVLADLLAVQATDLVASASSLRMIRRTLEAELVAGPLSVLAVFEGLQRGDGHTRQERRTLLPALYSRLGGRLLTIHCVGEPLDPETALFFTRAGLLLRQGFQ